LIIIDGARCTASADSNNQKASGVKRVGNARLGVAVVLLTRNRQVRIARLRERVGLAESRANTLLKIHQVFKILQ